MYTGPHDFGDLPSSNSRRRQQHGDDPHDMTPFDFAAAKRRHFMETARARNYQPSVQNHYGQHVNNMLPAQQPLTPSPVQANNGWLGSWWGPQPSPSPVYVPRDQPNGPVNGACYEYQIPNPNAYYHGQQRLVSPHYYNDYHQQVFGPNGTYYEDSSDEVSDEKVNPMSMLIIALLLCLCLLITLGGGGAIIYFAMRGSSSSTDSDESDSPTEAPTESPADNPVDTLCTFEALGLNGKEWETDDAAFKGQLFEFKEDDDDPKAFTVSSQKGEAGQTDFASGAFESEDDGLCTGSIKVNTPEATGKISMKPEADTFSIVSTISPKPIEFKKAGEIKEECSVENLKLADTKWTDASGKQKYTFAPEDTKNPLAWKFSEDGATDAADTYAGAFDIPATGPPDSKPSGFAAAKYCTGQLSGEDHDGETIWVSYDDKASIPAEVKILDKEQKLVVNLKPAAAPSPPVEEKCSFAALKLGSLEFKNPKDDAVTYKVKDLSTESGKDGVWAIVDPAKADPTYTMNIDKADTKPTPDGSVLAAECNFCTGLVQDHEGTTVTDGESIWIWVQDDDTVPSIYILNKAETEILFQFDANLPSRRRVLRASASNANEYSFSYSTISAFVIVAMSICLQSAYLIYR